MDWLEHGKFDLPVDVHVDISTDPDALGCLCHMRSFRVHCCVASYLSS